MSQIDHLSNYKDTKKWFKVLLFLRTGLYEHFIPYS
jgi:hypothetical protein